MADSGQCMQKYQFFTADETTDIVFVVEGKRIHFAKTILSMCSPVFRRMFAEKDAKEIPLPRKKYADMVEFFKHLHPAYGPMTQVRDDSLFTLLTLSTEYQIDSVREKCQQFIGHQAEVAQAASTSLVAVPEHMSVDQNLLYLWACDRFHLYQHQQQLVKLAAGREPLRKLTESPLFKQFETNSMIDVLCKKCEMLEQEVLEVENLARRKGLGMYFVKR